MNNKLNSVYVFLFLSLTFACSGQKKETVKFELFQVSVDSVFIVFNAWYPTLKSDKKIYQLKDTVTLNLSMGINLPMYAGVGGSSSDFEFKTKEHVEWNIYFEEELIFNYPKIFHSADSSNIVLNESRFRESFRWHQQDNDNKYVKTGEYKIVATILDIDHPLNAETIIRIE